MYEQATLLLHDTNLTLPLITSFKHKPELTDHNKYNIWAYSTSILNQTKLKN